MTYIILLVFCSPLSISSPFSWFSCGSDTLSSVFLFVFLSFSFLYFVCLCVCVCVHMCVLSSSVVSNSFWPRGLQSTRLLCPWSFPCRNTGVGYTLLLQVIFLTLGLNLHLLRLLHWILYYCTFLLFWFYKELQAHFVYFLPQSSNQLFI